MVTNNLVSVYRVEHVTEGKLTTRRKIYYFLHRNTARAFVAKNDIQRRSLRPVKLNLNYTPGNLLP
jgi:hypothetical protein